MISDVFLGRVKTIMLEKAQNSLKSIERINLNRKTVLNYIGLSLLSLVVWWAIFVWTLLYLFGPIPSFLDKQSYDNLFLGLFYYPVSVISAIFFGSIAYYFRCKWLFICSFLLPVFLALFIAGGVIISSIKIQLEN